MRVKDIYFLPWFPRVFYKKFDGGTDSGVVGYFLIECKPLFSVGLLHFKKGSREAFHSHAFNAITFWLKGRVTEVKYPTNVRTDFEAGFIPKFTPRSNFHKVISHADTWALTFRGPWFDYWYEVKQGKFLTLTHGRKLVNSQEIGVGHVN